MLSKKSPARALTLITALITITSMCEPACAAKKGVWKIEQVSECEGLISILIAEDAIKFSCRDQNLVCVTLAPKWNVVSYNPKEKLINDLSLEQWVQHGFRLFGRRQLDFLKQKSKVRQTWLSHPVELVSFVVTQSDPLKEKFELFYRESEGRSLEYNSVQFVYEKFIKLSPAQRSFVCSFCGVHQGNGLLLERTHIYPNGRRNTVLRTLSCKRDSVDTSQFSYPKNFKSVPEVRDVTMEKRKLEQAGTMLEEILGK